MNLFALLVVYQIKHFICDYPLQGAYMLGKFKKAPYFILPLLAHVTVHGLATFLIALACNSKHAVALSLFDMVVHFIMDRIKASPELLGQFKALSGNEYMKLVLPKQNPDDMEPKVRARFEARKNQLIKNNTYFWWSLGLDQMVHHLTHYVIIWFLVS